MNRKQRRGAKHRNVYAQARAQSEEEFRRALKRAGVELISVNQGQDKDGVQLWVLQVRRGDVTMHLSSLPKSIDAMVAGVVKALNDPPEAAAVEAPVQGPSAIVEAPPTSAVVAEEDLSRYLEV